MKWCVLVFIFSHFWRTIDAEGTNYVYSYAMASHCKECLRQGYVYNEFYAVDADDAKRIKSSKNVAFEMHIAIQAARDGHILLSPVPKPYQNTSVYEIVVGGGGNKFTELRRNLKRNAKASATTTNILSAVELRGFYVKILTSGLVEFGIEGATLPILSFVDLDPIDVRYFSFAAWNGVEAKFLYDCPVGSNMTNQSLSNSKPVERKMSNSDRLKKELLQDRPPHIAPGPSVKVRMGFLFSDLSFDSFESKLITKMALLTTWKDESMSWYAGKYGNVTSLTFRQGQVWRPMFHVFNSDSLYALRTSGHEFIRIASSGDASFHFKVAIETWCHSDEETNRWPRDKYSCSIVIEPWEAHEKISLAPLTYRAAAFKQFADTEEMTMNEWTVVNANQTIVSAYIWNLMYPSQNNHTYQGDRYVIQIELQREAPIFVIVFYTPLVVLMTFVLASFWSEPLQESRVWLYAGMTIVVCMGLCNIDYLMPCHTVPLVLVLYIIVLGGILFALAVQVILATALSEELCKTAVMQTILSSRWFRGLFCLPPMKICRNYNSINEGFLSQDEEDSEVTGPPRNRIEEMEEEKTKYCGKEELAEALDKTLFVVYSIMFAVMLSLYT